MSISPLYNCKSEKKLAKLLYIEYPHEYKKIKQQYITDEPNINYKNWTKTLNNKKREFFECKSDTLKLHKRINKLLNINIKTAPVYLQSGVKEKSYLKNVEVHRKNNFFLLIDIRNFYPSITKKIIKTSLIQQYKQSSDVAEFLSNAITVKQLKSKQRALPIGSPLSQNMAYFINKHMFDKLFQLANNYGITISVYVDDVSFSSKATIPFKFLNKVIYIIKKNGYEIATNKLYYGKLKAKQNDISSKKRLDITGVQLTKYGAFLTASRNQKIKKKRNIIIKKCQNKEVYDKELKSLISSIHQAILFNPKYKRYMKLIQSAFL